MQRFYPLLLFLAFWFCGLHPHTMWAQDRSILLHIHGSTLTLPLSEQGVTLPHPKDVGQYAFVGWSTQPIALSPIPPQWVGDRQGRISPNEQAKELYAVYQQAHGCTYFRRISTRPSEGKRYIFAGKNESGLTFALDAAKIPLKAGTATGTQVFPFLSQGATCLYAHQSTLWWDLPQLGGICPRSVYLFNSKTPYLKILRSGISLNSTSWEAGWKEGLCNPDAPEHRVYVTGTGTIRMAKGANKNYSLLAYEETEGSLIFYTSSPSYTVRMSEAHYATFSAPDPVAIPQGVQAFVGVLKANTLHLKEIHNIIPPHTGVVLYSPEVKSYDFIPLPHTSIAPRNDLHAAVREIKHQQIQNLPNHTFYALAHLNNRLAFYPVSTGVDIPAGKAYLLLSAEHQAQALRLHFLDAPLGLHAPPISPVRSTECYDLNGRRIVAPHSGQLYLQGGKTHLAH